MAKPNIDFLNFSAYSIKLLITRKLSEDTRMTDQIYEGSNVSILIDLFSYMAQLMLFSLNNAASESMFSDTRFYENMNRLVKFLGYNPRGFIPSTCTFKIITDADGNEYNDDIIIPRYSGIKTDIVDANGNMVWYSFINDYTTSLGSDNQVLLYNGRWKLYNLIFTASGTPYETFVLNNILSDTDKEKYVADSKIDVYVRRIVDGLPKFILFKGLTDEIFLNIDDKYRDGILIYSAKDSDRYYTIRLNENKLYEIKFGNGVNGLMLLEGDELYIFYLDSNGFDAKITNGLVIGNILLGADIVGMDDDFFKEIIYGATIDDADYNAKIEAISNFLILNITDSTAAQSELSVDEIRNVAPNFYKLGNRLITKDDFEYYVKNRYKETVIDVKCFNNWEYISNFYAWLYNIGKNGRYIEYKKDGEIRKSDPRYYINDVNFLKYGYLMSDPADSNNIYIFSKMQNDSTAWKETIKNDLMTMKVLTGEVVPLSPVNVLFAICAAPIERALEYLNTDAIFDANAESYIEVTVAENSIYANSTIKTLISNIIITAFNETDLALGLTVDVNDILSKIYAISGVERIRTVFSEKIDLTNPLTKKTYVDRYIDGLSFATWSSEVVDPGDDMNVSNINRTLEQFLFPKLYLRNNSISDYIKVIKRSFANTLSVVY